MGGHGYAVGAAVGTYVGRGDIGGVGDVVYASSSVSFAIICGRLRSDGLVVAATLGGVTVSFTLGDVAGISFATCFAASLSKTVFVLSKMVVRALIWSILLGTRGGGMFPRRALVSCFAAWTIASAGVIAGLVMCLCLKITVSDPLIRLVSRFHPQ